VRPVRVSVMPLLLCVPATIFADSKGYVVAGGTNNMPGAIAPLSMATGTFGAPYFVRPGGSQPLRFRSLIPICRGRKNLSRGRSIENGPVY
jgi:hypothetical protein